MAKRKIVWSHRARTSLFKLLDFYAERNKSRAYSQKLYKKINKELSLLITHPDLGIQTEIEAVRGLIVDEFILYYEASFEGISVLYVWDCRQNPGSLRIK